MSVEILTAIGGLCTVGLTINAYFIKTLVDSINGLSVNVAVLVANEKHSTSRIEGAEAMIKGLQKSDTIIREGMHELRTSLGNRIQILELKDSKQ